MKVISCSLLSLVALFQLPALGDDSFADYLPKDCAVYFEAYNKKGLLSSEIADLFVERKAIIIEEAEELLPLGEHKMKEAAEAFDSGEDVAKVVGSHMVLAVGGEANELVGDVGKLYHEFSGLLAGAQMELLLSAVEMLSEDGEAAQDMLGDLGGEEMLSGLDKFQLGFFLDSLAKDDQLALPSAYLAMRPPAKELEEYWSTLGDLLDEEEKKAESDMQRIPLSEGKWPRQGMKSKEDAAMAKELRTWWEGASEEERGPLDEKRFKKLEAALASFEFTIMWAKVDGWLVFYVGNGPEGFRLEEDVSESIAEDGKLAEVTKMSGSADAWMRWRVSKDFLKGLPTWLNDSPSVRAQAMVMAEHGELKNAKAMSDALYGIAKSRSLMSRREVKSDWYGIGWLEDGLRIETVGGMRKPGLDYDAEWTLSGGAKSAGTLFKAQWVGDSSYEKWGWEQSEALLTLVGSALVEWMPEESPVSREFLNESLMGWMSTMVQSGKELSLDGLGRESVVAIDLLGEMPQVPDAPSEVLEHGKIPRILYARTVAGREKVAKSGSEMMEASEGFWKQVNDELGSGVPFPGVVSSEDGALSSAMVFLPFSNDDFHLYTGLSDEVLIHGTSRRQAQLFERGLKKKSDSGSGLLVEMDLKKGVNYLKLWDRLTDSAVLPLGQADAMLDGVGLEQDESVEEQMSKLKSLRYHHREEEGELRSSFSFEAK